MVSKRHQNYLSNIERSYLLLSRPDFIAHKTVVQSELDHLTILSYMLTLMAKQ